jgi:hypothetical protein
VNLDPGAKKTTRFLLSVAHVKKISRKGAKVRRIEKEGRLEDSGKRMLLQASAAAKRGS